MSSGSLTILPFVGISHGVLASESAAETIYSDRIIDTLSSAVISTESNLGDYSHELYVGKITDISSSYNIQTEHGLDIMDYMARKLSYSDDIDDFAEDIDYNWTPQAMDRLSNVGIYNDDDSSDSNVIDGTLAYIVLITVGSASVFLLDFIFFKCPIVRLPISVTWFLIGSVIATLTWTGKDHGHDNILINGIEQYVMNVDQHVVYMILLPTLLYEGSLNVNKFKFHKFLLTNLFLATIAVLATCFTVGGMLMTLVRQDLVSASEAFLMGAMVSSTDPVAVISVLKNMNCPDKLSAIFEGESLLNDGVSVVIYQVIATYAKSQKETGADIMIKILRLVIGSPLYGAMHSIIATIICKICRGQPELQSVWLTINATLAFFIGETCFHMSGPLVAVMYGLVVNFMSNRTMEKDAQQAHESVVKNASCVCEMLIFMLAGAIIMNMLLNGYEYILANTVILDGFYLFLIMNVSRIANTLCFMPIIKLYCPYSISFKEQLLLWWGGLRGAIVIALCLVVYDDGEYRDGFRLDAPIIIAIAVAFNLLIQGGSFGPFFKLLNPYPPTAFLVKYNRYQCNKFERDFIDHIIEVYATLQDLERKDQNSTSSARATDGLKRKESIIYSLSAITSSGLRSPTSEVGRMPNINTFRVHPNVHLQATERCHKEKYVQIAMSLDGDTGDVPMAYGLRLFLPLYSQYLSEIDDIMHEFVTTTANALPNFSKVGPDKQNRTKLIPADIRKSLCDWIDYVHVTDMEDDLYDDSKSLPTLLRIRRLKKKNTYSHGGSSTDLMRMMTSSSILNIDLPTNNVQVDEMKAQRVSEVMLMTNRLVISKYEDIHSNCVINNTSYSMLRNAIEESSFLAERSLEELARGNLTGAQKLCETLVGCEWTTIKKELHIHKLKSKLSAFIFYEKYPNRVFRSVLFRNCLADLECLLTYLDAHEHVLVLGGNEVIQMMQGPILEFYEKSIMEAQEILWAVINIYQDILHSALFILMAKILTQQKLMFVRRLCKKGLLSRETVEAMEFTLEGVMMKLFNYRDFLRDVKSLRAIKIDIDLNFTKQSSYVDNLTASFDDEDLRMVV